MFQHTYHLNNNINNGNNMDHASMEDPGGQAVHFTTDPSGYVTAPSTIPLHPRVDMDVDVDAESRRVAHYKHHRRSTNMDDFITKCIILSNEGPVGGEPAPGEGIENNNNGNTDNSDNNNTDNDIIHTGLSTTTCQVPTRGLGSMMNNRIVVSTRNNPVCNNGLNQMMDVRTDCGTATHQQSTNLESLSSEGVFATLNNKVTNYNGGVEMRSGISGNGSVGNRVYDGRGERVEVVIDNGGSFHRQRLQHSNSIDDNNNSTTSNTNNNTTTNNNNNNNNTVVGAYRVVNGNSLPGHSDDQGILRQLQRVLHDYKSPVPSSSSSATASTLSSLLPIASPALSTPTTISSSSLPFTYHNSNGGGRGLGIVNSSNSSVNNNNNNNNHHNLNVPSPSLISSPNPRRTTSTNNHNNPTSRHRPAQILPLPPPNTSSAHASSSTTSKMKADSSQTITAPALKPTKPKQSPIHYTNPHRAKQLPHDDRDASLMRAIVTSLPTYSNASVQHRNVSIPKGHSSSLGLKAVAVRGGKIINGNTHRHASPAPLSSSSLIPSSSSPSTPPSSSSPPGGPAVVFKTNASPKIFLSRESSDASTHPKPAKASNKKLFVSGNVWETLNAPSTSASTTSVLKTGVATTSHPGLASASNSGVALVLNSGLTQVPKSLVTKRIAENSPGAVSRKTERIILCSPDSRLIPKQQSHDASKKSLSKSSEHLIGKAVNKPDAKAPLTGNPQANDDTEMVDNSTSLLVPFDGACYESSAEAEGSHRNDKPTDQRPPRHLCNNESLSQRSLVMTCVLNDDDVVDNNANNNDNDDGNNACIDNEPMTGCDTAEKQHDINIKPNLNHQSKKAIDSGSRLRSNDVSAKGTVCIAVMDVESEKGEHFRVSSHQTTYNNNNDNNINDDGCSDDEVDNDGDNDCNEEGGNRSCGIGVVAMETESDDVSTTSSSFSSIRRINNNNNMNSSLMNGQTSRAPARSVVSDDGTLMSISRSSLTTKLVTSSLLSSTRTMSSNSRVLVSSSSSILSSPSSSSSSLSSSSSSNTTSLLLHSPLPFRSLPDDKQFPSSSPMQFSNSLSLVSSSSPRSSSPSSSISSSSSSTSSSSQLSSTLPPPSSKSPSSTPSCSARALKSKTSGDSHDKHSYQRQLPNQQPENVSAPLHSSAASTTSTTNTPTQSTSSKASTDSDNHENCSEVTSTEPEHPSKTRTPATESAECESTTSDGLSPSSSSSSSSAAVNTSSPPLLSSTTTAYAPIPDTELSASPTLTATTTTDTASSKALSSTLSSSSSSSSTTSTSTSTASLTLFPLERRLRNRQQRKFLPEKVRQKRQTLQDMTRPLKKWLYRNRKNPYPSKDEKMDLVKVSNMTLTQVSNWFANARRRMKSCARSENLSWAKRIKEYNQVAEGNVELFSIPSEDDEEDDEEEEEDDGDDEDENNNNTNNDTRESFGSSTTTNSHREFIREEEEEGEYVEGDDGFEENSVNRDFELAIQRNRPRLHLPPPPPPQHRHSHHPHNNHLNHQHQQQQLQSRGKRKHQHDEEEDIDDNLTPSPSPTLTSFFNGVSLTSPPIQPIGSQEIMQGFQIPAHEDAMGSYPKYKHSILQRYLHDASNQSLLHAHHHSNNNDMAVSSSSSSSSSNHNHHHHHHHHHRHRHPSSSTGSHDFEDLSTSSLSSPTHDLHDDLHDEFESLSVRHRRMSENSTIVHSGDDLYWKEIAAALALTSLARTFNNPA